MGGPPWKRCEHNGESFFWHTYTCRRVDERGAVVERLEILVVAREPWDESVTIEGVNSRGFAEGTTITEADAIEAFITPINQRDPL